MTQFEEGGAGTENKSEARAQALPATHSCFSEQQSGTLSAPTGPNGREATFWTGGEEAVTLITQAGSMFNCYSHWHLTVGDPTMLSACEKFQGEGYRLPKHQTCFSIYCCVASPAKGCWKGWLLLSSASLPGWLMTLTSLSFPLEKTCRRTDVLGPQKQKEPGGREGEGLTRPPKKPSSCAPLPRPHSTHQARPLPLPPSLAEHKLHRLSISSLLPASSRSQGWENVFKALLLFCS